MGSTTSGQVIICLYPLGCAMIPSLGIMSSQGDRRDNYRGAYNITGPSSQAKLNTPGDQVNYLTLAPKRQINKMTMTFIQHNNFLAQKNQSVQIN
jgi:hypothetical protein